MNKTDDVAVSNIPDDTDKIDVNVVCQLIENRVSELNKYIMANKGKKVNPSLWAAKFMAREELLKLKYEVALSLEKNKFVIGENNDHKCL